MQLSSYNPDSKVFSGASLQVTGGKQGKNIPVRYNVRYDAVLLSILHDNLVGVH